MLEGIVVGSLSPGVLLLYFGIVLISWGYLNSLSLFMNRPEGIRVVNCSSLTLGKWFSTLDYLLRAKSIITKAYKESGGLPFAVVALKSYQVLVSRADHIKDLGNAPERVLSFNAVVRDRVEPGSIMLGFSHHDEFDPDGAVTLRAIKILLRESIPQLSKAIALRLDESCCMVIDPCLKQKGDMEVSVLSFAKEILVRSCIQICYGNDYATDPLFNQIVLSYWWDSAYGTALFELLPRSIAPYFVKFFMFWKGSMHKVGEVAGYLMKKRLGALDEELNASHVDMAQFLLQSSRAPGQKDPVRLQQLLVAMTFVFAHQPPIALAWVLIELARHPEYMQLLRDEILTAEQQGHKDIMSHLPLMECVLREVSRLYTLDGLTIQRKALRPFTFSDGTSIQPGTNVAIPQQAIMRDPELYSDPDTFDPFRFKPHAPEDQARIRWTDINERYTYWGSTARPCPGRWMVSHLLKSCLVILLKKYDFELTNPNNRTSVRWTTVVVPATNVHLSIKMR